MGVLLDVLAAAGVEVRETGKQDEYTICCPFCEPADEKFHFGLNTTQGLGHCFRCDWASRGVFRTARLLAHAYGISHPGLWQSAKPVKRRRVDDDVAPPAEERHVPATPYTLPAEYESLFSPGAELDPAQRQTISYLRGRGVSLLQMARHKVGYASCGRLAWRALFPVMDEQGAARGCVARAVSGQLPKYLNSTGIKHIWGVHVPGSVAVLSEGLLDALAVERALMRRTGYVALADLGCSLTHVQLAQLRQYRSLILFPDHDVAGLNGVIRVGEKCHAAGLRVEVHVPSCVTGRDPGDMSEQEISDRLASLRPWSRETVERIRFAMTRREHL